MTHWHLRFPEHIGCSPEDETPCHMPPTPFPEHRPIHVCFDWDSTVANSGGELIVREHGMDAFISHEIENVDIPHEEGPMLPLLRLLRDSPDFKISIVTARGGRSAARMLRTLQHWNIHVDGVFCCDGGDKGALSKAINADILIDDHHKNISDAFSNGIPAAVVKTGT